MVGVVYALYLPPSIAEYCWTLQVHQRWSPHHWQGADAMIKRGVDLRGLQPQMALAYTIACQIWHGKCTITSGSDGVHGPNSLHYKGKALDLRTRDLPPAVVMDIHTDLKTALGEQFDVVIEEDHIHVEFDPKDTPKDTL